MIKNKKKNNNKKIYTQQRKKRLSREPNLAIFIFVFVNFPPSTCFARKVFFFCFVRTGIFTARHVRHLCHWICKKHSYYGDEHKQDRIHSTHI